MLVFSAADFEDFRQPRPEMGPEMEGELEEVVRVLAQNRWPWRMHATYDETIRRALDVFERVNRDIPLDGLHWFFDHAETISEASIDRIAALGGGVAVQHRMAYQGEYFVERYGAAAAEATPPVARMLAKGIHVSAGTDATRVASYNPWVSLAWLITGKTVGGLRITPQRNCLDRETALRMWTEKVAWFSDEEGRKGVIREGSLADLTVPDRDFYTCPESDIADTTALLTVVGGKVVYGAGEFAPHDEAGPPPPMPDWSPVRRFGGYGAWGREGRRAAAGQAREKRPARLRLQSRLRRPWPRPPRRGTPVDSRGRSRELLGSTGMRMLGSVTIRWLALLALCAAYLQGGLMKAFDFAGAIAELQHFGLPPIAALVVLTIVVEIGASLLILTGIQRWAGAVVLAGFTLFATFVANRFWEMAPPERFMAENAFFEHIGLIGGFVLVAWHDLKQRLTERA